MLALWLMLLAHAPVMLAQEPESEPELLILEVRLDQSVLSGAIPAYAVGNHTLLPLGELASLLTISIQTQPVEGVARGFILSEDRGFSLNLDNASVTLAGNTQTFDPALVLAEPDDIYVAASLLEDWLPLTFEVDRASLSLRAHALEALPLQARLAREDLGGRAGMPGGYEDPDYPRHEQPYRLLSVPFIDQTLTTEVQHSNNRTQGDTAYTAYLTGDLLGMETSLYFSSGLKNPSPEVRATLGRHDPDGELLGPLHARSFQLGSFSTPSVDNVSRGIGGEGVTLSNRPLTRPTSFDRQTFEGDLLPGWDVELYYNGALVSFAQPDAEGRYRFEDQPLSYGRNDFRLIFNGPLGETRVEQYSFPLDQSMVLPGDFQYSLTEHRDDDGQSRTIAQFDLGLSRSLTASAGLIRAPTDGEEELYSTLGVRTFWRSLSLGGGLVQAKDGGALAKLDVQTRIGGVAVDASRILLTDFTSEVFTTSNDPILTRDALRLTGSLPLTSRSRIPLTLEATRDERESGRANTDVSARVSAYVYRTALTNTLRWRASDISEDTTGSLQVSRRVRDMSLRGQVDYRLDAESDISSVALSAEKYLADGYRGALGIAHTFLPPETRYSAGLTKSLGRFGLGVSASYVDTGDIALGAQLFIAMGRDSRRSDWRFDAQPMANTGAASVRVFIDEDNDGVMGNNEAPLQGAGFKVNGVKHRAHTDAEGIAYIDHLPVKQHLDIAIDTATLEDPQWAPEIEGLRLVPRPGSVASLEFPVRMTTEIDGTVYLLEKGVERGVGDIELELLNNRQEVVARTTSSWDGFYIVPGVIAGEYQLRISPQQLQRLSLSDSGRRELTVSGDGDFISGIDLKVFPSSLTTPLEPVVDFLD
ncbi:hypothetical protein SAMN04487951_101334 [Vreelandella arcis]|uniref:Carboxypeptidase regulatory-like domain-containing protein n=2 Tax=Vreelandella arcis TaxID=416873 RepID=A0A1G9XNB5_9GAMM|nr:hypothetical protein SAMN04487951_101334 [Halomonas arcis]